MSTLSKTETDIAHIHAMLYQVSQYADLFFPKYSCNLNNLLITVLNCVHGVIIPQKYLRGENSFRLLTLTAVNGVMHYVPFQNYSALSNRWGTFMNF